ncbi:nucleoid-associated protein RdgC [Vibrio chagasii]|nr:nucleoid-associated protein RdgC [Vibrio chagasii]
MWFKNCLVYRFNREIKLDVATLEEQLAEFAFKPCEGQKRQSFGWTHALGKHGDTFAHSADGNILLSARKEEKILPAGVINEYLQERIEEAEARLQRTTVKKEKDTYKDEVITDLLPRAFSRNNYLNLVILPKQQMIVVDASSSKKAEDVLALLRKTIGSLPVVPAIPATPVETTLTSWVKDGAPNGFQLHDEADFKSIQEDGGIVKTKDLDLGCDEVVLHIENNRLVTRLAVNWQDRISFILSEDGSVKRLKFSDELKDEHDDIPREDQRARFDADFALMTGEFTSFLPDLYEGLGGLPEADA